VIILGAGFDARAHRIPGIERTRVFELDLPQPQQLKRARLEQALGASPPHVTYVPIDFDRQPLQEALAAAGYQARARTLTIWEGVTQYITAEAVDATFRAIARTAGPGSEVVFTYIHQGIIDGTARSRWTSGCSPACGAAARRGSMAWTPRRWRTTWPSGA
jgi:methyltransferase (TIGR00027 family)